MSARTKSRAAAAPTAPPGTPAKPAAPPGPDESREEGVTRLAARGLDEDEIRVRLGLSAALDAAEEQALGAAFDRGRLLGRALIKEAQFDSALAGRVTAQAQVLERLGEPDGGGETEDGTIEDAAGTEGVPEDDALEQGGPARPGAVAVERRILAGKPPGASGGAAGPD